MKKSFKYLIISLISAGTFFSCEDVITLETTTGPIRLVVDGWLSDQPTSQTITLTQTANYFTSGGVPPALGAMVRVTDETGRIFTFTDEKNNGKYVWKPTATQPTIGTAGRKLSLLVQWQNEQYAAQTEMKRSPSLDSITYYFDKPAVVPENSPKEGYIADFYGRDFQGTGDCYWFKFYKNNKRYNQDAQDISIAYDAAFSPGAATDGKVFILPIRRAINVGNKLFSEKDTVRAEVWSVTPESFFFLQAVQTESSNRGIFATPPNNIQTNVLNLRSGGPTALGWFGASAVRTVQTIVKKENAVPKP